MVQLQNWRDPWVSHGSRFNAIYLGQKHTLHGDANGPKLSLAMENAQLRWADACRFSWHVLHRKKVCFGRRNNDAPSLLVIPAGGNCKVAALNGIQNSGLNIWTLEQCLSPFITSNSQNKAGSQWDNTENHKTLINQYLVCVRSTGIQGLDRPWSWFQLQSEFVWYNCI